MAWHSSRRTVLRATTAIAVGSVAGCLLNNQDTRGSSLFIENTKGAEQLVQLIVSPGERVTDDRVLDDWYRVPNGVALEFQKVLESGETYTIGLQAVEEDSSEHLGVTVDPCEGDSDGTRDVSVRIREDAHGIIPWGCDEQYTERELDYRDAEEHSVDAPDDAEPWTSPTPGTEDGDGGGLS